MSLVSWILLCVIVIPGSVALVVWTVIRSDDPAGMVFKWALSLVVMGFLLFKVARIVGGGGYGGAFIGIPLTAACGLTLAIIWRHELTDLVANPIASLYYGGDGPPEPAPAYSVAHARQKAGKYQEAIEEVRKQLAMFPQDLDGHMLLASIQAQDLKDLEAAEQTIMEYCAQPGHGPRSLIFALFSLADWHLEIKQDAEGARRALSRICELLPGTEFELSAAQRLAHLDDPAAMLSDHGRQFPVRPADPNLGLRKDAVAQAGPSTKSPEELAADYVRHLELHPADNEVRELLANLYWEHYQRLDMASMELETIIATPKQPARAITHALGTLADLQKKARRDYDTIRATLERILAVDPKSAAAEVARRRIDLLRLELKANEKQAPVKLGDYEQDIGLKRPPH